MISVLDVTKRFGEKMVLDGVSMTVQDGEIFGLLGPSGAGKTTLIRILTGQLRAESGEVMVLGKRVSALSGADKKQFGIMMDDFGLYERLNCYQNLKVFADIYGVDDRAIAQVLAEVKLESARHVEVSKLSKGMKERLRLARALLTRPKVLVLDEPTSGLDPRTRYEFKQLVGELSDRGKTIIISSGTVILLTTHNMAEAEKLCDHLVLLHEGRIIESGSPKEICLRYDQTKKIVLTTRDGRAQTWSFDTSGTSKDLKMREDDATHRLQQLDEMTSAVRKALEENDLAMIHSQEPNLETVFMALTGKRLEE